MSSPAVYIVIWLITLALLGASVGSSFVPMGTFNLVVTLTIAVIQTVLTMTYYMHLRHHSIVMRLFAAGAFLWLSFLVTFTLADVLTRHVPKLPI